MRLIPTCLLPLTLVLPLFAAERYEGDNLRPDIGAAEIARGGTGVLLSSGVSRSWWNPALLQDQGRKEFGVQHSELFGGLVKQDFLGMTGTFHETPFGIYLFRASVPDIPLTSSLDGGSLENGGRPVISDRVDSADWLLAVASSRQITDRLDAGISLKLIYRDLASLSATGIGLDLGLRYRLDHGFALGLSMKDLPATVVLWDDGESDTIWPEVRTAVSWLGSLPWLGAKVRSELSLATDLEGETASADGEFRSFWVDGGLEFQLLQRLFLRGGLSEGNFTAGAGLKFSRIRVDYAFRPHSDLDSSHLISAGFLF